MDEASTECAQSDQDYDYGDLHQQRAAVGGVDECVDASHLAHRLEGAGRHDHHYRRQRIGRYGVGNPAWIVRLAP